MYIAAENLALKVSPWNGKRELKPHKNVDA